MRSLRFGRVKIHGHHFALFMNGQTLWHILIPVAGIKTIEELLPLFLEMVGSDYAMFGIQVDPKNHAVIITNRSDRKQIGSMNDAVRVLKHGARIAVWNSEPIDWFNEVLNLQNMPYKRLGFVSPVALMKELPKQANP